MRVPGFMGTHGYRTASSAVITEQKRVGAGGSAELCGDLWSLGHSIRHTVTAVSGWLWRRQTSGCRTPETF